MGSQYIGQHVVQIRHDTTHSSFGTVTPQVPDLATIVTGLVVAMQKGMAFFATRAAHDHQRFVGHTIGRIMPNTTASITFYRDVRG